MKKLKTTKSLAYTSERIRVLADQQLQLANGGRQATSSGCIPPTETCIIAVL